MKPLDIYNLTPKHATTDIECLRKHFKNIDGLDFWTINYEKNERILIKEYHFHLVDGRRTWQMFSVWMDEKPVMICEQAGREGDDIVREYVTDQSLCLELIEYMKMLMETEEDDFPFQAFQPDEEIEELGVFYGFSLKDFYDTDVQLEYKVGDIVEADVCEERRYGYIFDDCKFIKTKILITEVNQHNSHHSYRGYDLERQRVGKFNPDKEKNTLRIVELQEGEELTGSKVYVHLNIDLKEVD